MTDPAQGPTQILVVDDVDSNLLALEALLGSPSVSVVRARSGQEALNALRDKEFALVVLDVHMPEMDGFQTAAAIRQNESTRRLPIIFVTAHGTTKEKLAKAYELGVSEFLTKPIDTEALRAKVGVLMELARAINETRQNAETRTEQRLVEERQRWENEALRARVQEQQRATAAEHAARLEAETANRVKDEFLATLSHELRAPLNAIVGWASLMRARGPSEPSFSRGLDVIERNARAQTKLIDDMLDSSRIIAGKLRLDMAAVDLRQIIQRAVDAIRPDAERKRLVLTVELSPDLPIIPGDPERLHQVFANLSVERREVHSGRRRGLSRGATRAVSGADQGVGHGRRHRAGFPASFV